MTFHVDSDIVAALLRMTGANLLSADPRRIHRAMRLAAGLCPLLERFQPTLGTEDILSRTLDEALGRLRLSRILRMENTDYRRYILDDQSRAYVDASILPRFALPEREALARAAAVVREVCGESSQEPAIPPQS